MDFKAFFYRKTNRIPLKTQLSFLVIITFSVVILLIIWFNYRSSSQAIINQQNATLSSLLNLENQNLDAYFGEIGRYSLLLRHNASFMRFLRSEQSEMTYAEKTVLQNLLQSNFDSRTDLISYRVYLLHSSMHYQINAKEHMVLSFFDNRVQDLPDYDLFTQGPYYKAIRPSKNPKAFFVFYRTIIRIEDQAPLAVVELTFDHSFIESLAQNHQNPGELYFLVDQQNRLLYANQPQKISQEILETCLQRSDQSSVPYFQSEWNNEKYLVVLRNSTTQGYRLFDCQPLSGIDRRLAETRNISLILALLAVTVVDILVSLFITFITRPLSVLAHRLEKVGSGNFTATADISGSPEIVHLAESFNSMIVQINDLIQKTYVSALNEKTAQLTALEAQVNPHFLYNILQAISTEAIINHQEKINFMISALASMLRYSVKGGDFADLSTELRYVKDYLLLQQARFEENLTYELLVAEGTGSLFVPKISLQILVENSISHGMSGDSTRIHLNISTRLEGDFLILEVTDNGKGMTAEELNALRQRLKNDLLPSDKTTGIGLVNLNSRLRILFDQKASLSVTSIPYHKTTVLICIPILKELPHV